MRALFHGRTERRDDTGDDMVHGFADPETVEFHDVAGGEGRVWVVDQVVGWRCEVLNPSLLTHHLTHIWNGS